MKKIKLLLPILGVSTTAGLIAPVAVACNKGEEKIHIDYEAHSFQELEAALSNPEYKVIAIAENINIPDNGQEFALKINRPVTIVGNENEIKWVDEQGLGKNNHTLIKIDITDTGANDNEVKFIDTKLTYNGYAGWSSTIFVDHLDGSKLTIDNCDILNGQNGQHKSYYALEIGPENVKGSEISIKNKSFLNAWGAVYNLGSNVKLKASKSAFSGTTASTSMDDEFSTIVVSDFPMVQGSTLKHCFSANNNFKFDDCHIYLGLAGEMDLSNQFFVENRCPANNIAEFTNCDFNESYSTIDEIYFLNVTENLADITNENIEKYCSASAGHADVPQDLLNAKTADEYYNYYGTSMDDPLHSKIIVSDEYKNKVAEKQILTTHDWNW